MVLRVAHSFRNCKATQLPVSVASACHSACNNSWSPWRPLKLEGPPLRSMIRHWCDGRIGTRCPVVRSWCGWWVPSHPIPSMPMPVQPAVGRSTSANQRNQHNQRNRHSRERDLGVIKCCASPPDALIQSPPTRPQNALIHCSYSMCIPSHLCEYYIRPDGSVIRYSIPSRPDMA